MESSAAGRSALGPELVPEISSLLQLLCLRASATGCGEHCVNALEAMNYRARGEPPEVRVWGAGVGLVAESALRANRRTFIALDMVCLEQSEAAFLPQAGLALEVHSSTRSGSIGRNLPIATSQPLTVMTTSEDGLAGIQIPSNSITHILPNKGLCVCRSHDQMVS